MKIHYYRGTFCNEYQWFSKIEKPNRFFYKDAVKEVDRMGMQYPNAKIDFFKLRDRPALYCVSVKFLNEVDEVEFIIKEST